MNGSRSSAVCLPPAVARPRWFAGADQPARLSMEIDKILVGSRSIRIVTEDVLHLPFCALTRLCRIDGANLPTVLVAAPLSCHFSLLLRDVVLGLLPSFQVVVTDWVNARYVDVEHGPFTLQHNISYLVEAMALLGPRLNVIALCQAGVPALAAAACLAQHRAEDAPRHLVLIAAPIDPAANATRVSRLIKARPLAWYERNALMRLDAPETAAGRLVYPGSIQLLGLWSYLARHMRENGELVNKLLADDGAEPLRFPFIDLYSTVMDIPGELFLDVVRHVYHERTMAQSNLYVDDQKIDLEAITATALMTVEAAWDDIAAPGQTDRAHDLCPSIAQEDRRRILVPECGHFSLFHGQLWRRHVLPEVTAWFSA